MATQDPAPGGGMGWDEPLSPISPSAAARRRSRRTSSEPPPPSEPGTPEGPLYRILDAINQLQAQTTQLTRRVQSLESAIRLAGVEIPEGEDAASIPSGPGLGRLRRRAKAADPAGAPPPSTGEIAPTDS